MKNSDMKVIAIILSIALLFTIITSNAVSVVSVITLLKDGGTVAVDGAPADGNNGGSTSNSGSTSSNSGSTSSNSGSTSSNSGSTSNNSGSSTDSQNTQTDNKGDSQNNGGDKTPDTNNGADQGSKPADGQETFNFYKKSVDAIKKEGKVKSFARKEWQEVVSFDMGAASEIVKGLIQGFMKTEDQAEPTISDNAEDIMRRMCPCDADFAKVASATTVEENGNYVVTIVMQDEETPTKGSNGIAAMATGILYLEDVVDTVQNDPTVSKIVTNLRDAKMLYHAYTIKAVMTKDGQFISIDHETTADLEAKATIDLKLTQVDLGGKGSMKFISKFYDFVY